MEKDMPCKWKSKEWRSSNSPIKKIDFKIKNITKDKKGYYIMIQGINSQKKITIVVIYAPNIGDPQYIRQTLIYIKGENDSNTLIVGDLISH